MAEENLALAVSQSMANPSKARAQNPRSSPAGDASQPSAAVPAGTLSPPDHVLAAIGMAGRVSMTLIRWGATVWIFSYLVPIMQALAGRETKASVLLQFFANIPVRDIICGLFGMGGLGWGAAERHTRKRRIAELVDHHKTLEQHIDANRSTSGLTKYGVNPKLP